MTSLPVQYAAVPAESNRGQLPLDEPSESRTILSNSLSSQPGTTPVSSTKPPQEPASPSEAQHFHSIGRGYCAEIFSNPGTRQIYKRAHPPHDLQLWNDYIHHTAIYHTIHLHCPPPIDLLIPHPHTYISHSHFKWWTAHRPHWPLPSLREPTDLLQMELIPPLPSPVREALITQYCPPAQTAQARADPKNEHCLIRVYLGRRRSFTPRGEFSLRNFEADLTILEELQLDKTSHARAMATAFAIMHWNAKTDAADVEFVLGSPPSELHLSAAEIAALPPRTDIGTYLASKQKAAHLWLLDFNRCDTITLDAAGLAKAVRAFWDNDPYYPRPVPEENGDEGLWRGFEEAYLAQSARSADEHVKGLGLPKMFIERVVEEARRRGEVGSGPPSGPPRGAGTGEEGVVGNPAGGRRGRGGRRRGGFEGVLERLNLDDLR
ncbi:hypothetical protein MMC30_002887 [Trapelia coarctata]|nr:hypothetical protein [Trapelia coarctata]